VPSWHAEGQLYLYLFICKYMMMTFTFTLTCEGKGLPITYHEGTQGEWRYSCTHSQPSCQMGVSGQCHIPAASSQERTLIAIVEEVDVEHN